MRSDPVRASSDLEWRGYGDFSLFHNTDAKIAEHEARLARVLDVDEALHTRAEHVYALAGLYWAKRDYDVALQRFQQAAQLAVDLGDAEFQAWCHNGLGDIYAATGRHDEAVSAYRRALDLNSASAYAYLGLGCVHGDLLGQYEAASASYRRALELGGLNAHLISIAYNGLGNVFHAQGDEEAAIAAYRLAVEADPGFLSPHDNLGAIAMQQGRFAMAQRHFKERIRLRPGHSLGAYVALGIMARQEGDPESEGYFCRALESFDAAWQAQYDTQAGLLQKKGLALLGLGRRDEALDCLQHMMEQRVPGDAIDFVYYELLRTAPHPPAGIEEALDMLCQADAIAAD